MDQAITGVILAGGLSSRFDGIDKSQLRIGGQRILDRLLEIFSEFFDDIIIVTNEPLRYLDRDVRIVTDLLPLRSSLTGLYTGLFYARYLHTFMIACDTPFLKREMVKLVIDRIDPETDIVMPHTSAGMEPLCAAYSRKCLRTAEQHLKEKKLKIQLALRSCRMKTISESAIREIDPELISFFNVNKPEDLIKAEELAADHGYL
jgi:molybdopterin-guanine dinucleotide biosynthesis protein A